MTSSLVQLQLNVQVGGEGQDVMVALGKANAMAGDTVGKDTLKKMAEDLDLGSLKLSDASLPKLNFSDFSLPNFKEFAADFSELGDVIPNFKAPNFNIGQLPNLSNLKISLNAPDIKLPGLPDLSIDAPEGV